ncbi:Xylose isomerase domain protein TIM barrel [Indibacter alkaliphilus LW1]|uniref:Xylose isomerase domain protein TIM barrel n=1 Tax=Indibacter alkaliphilus (strain CCUG 57479 / KCTC 22604 / LW1) TaxID=1189612 RepID=S2DT33_INDAL|nr:TIM barrel protein [Indibacter alkaliphilus]EOZ95231.1 Xylose isomerase domain protein TIM barrel [Indibacter alkaliphilus LW1]
MKRRQFSKITGISVLGLSTSPTLLWSAQENNSLRLGGPVFEKYDSPDSWIQALKKSNYRAAYCPVGIDASRETIQAYEAAAKEANIIIAEVGAWSNPISPDKSTAQAAFQKCVDSLQLAEDIGANCCVNIAGSNNRENWAGPHPDNFSEDTFDQIVETTRKIIDEVDPKRTFFTLEAMPWIFPENPDSYLKLLKAIDRKAFGVHLDPVNMMVSPAVFYKNSNLIKECFEKLGPHIKSCHAKDLILKERTYMPQFEEVIPGRGMMDYRTFMIEIKKSPHIPVMMEHLETAEEYLQGANYIRSKAKEVGLVA